MPLCDATQGQGQGTCCCTSPKQGMHADPMVVAVEAQHVLLCCYRCGSGWPVSPGLWLAARQQQACQQMILMMMGRMRGRTRTCWQSWSVSCDAHGMWHLLEKGNDNRLAIAVPQPDSSRNSGSPHNYNACCSHTNVAEAAAVIMYV